MGWRDGPIDKGKSLNQNIKNPGTKHPRNPRYMKRLHLWIIGIEEGEETQAKGTEDIKMKQIKKQMKKISQM